MLIHGIPHGITLIALGILAVPSLLLSRRPDAKGILDKITPYQGWIGVIFCIIGLLNLLSALFNLNVLFYFPIYGLIYLADAVVMTLLGFILGYPLIQQYALSKNATASEKGVQVLQKIRPMQGKLGVLAIIVGIILIVLAISYRI